jgi:hypothetical protein
MEFLAYRILYYVYLKSSNIGGSANLINCLATLPPEAERYSNYTEMQ